MADMLVLRKAGLVPLDGVPVRCDVADSIVDGRVVRCATLTWEPEPAAGLLSRQEVE